MIGTRRLSEVIATEDVVLQVEMVGTTRMGAGQAEEVDPQASEEAPGTMVARPSSVQLREQLPGLP